MESLKSKGLKKRDDFEREFKALLKKYDASILSDVDSVEISFWFEDEFNTPDLDLIWWEY